VFDEEKIRKLVVKIKVEKVKKDGNSDIDNEDLAKALLQNLNKCIKEKKL